MANDDYRNWLRRETGRFAHLRPTYLVLADVLDRILTRARDRFAPMGHVSARAKTLQSFAEKAIRKREKYQQPCLQLTDLAGGRVVTYTPAEAEAICRWLERESEISIDWANSLDTRQRLRAGEFGYLASHYVVQLSGSPILGVRVEPGLSKLKCEIQISTFLQHVWAAIGHDRIYKSHLRIPEQIERKTAETAALLELADAAFAETTSTLDQYLTDFETSLPLKELGQEIQRWEAVLHADPKDPKRDDISCRIGRLYLAKQQPRIACRKMDPLRTSKRPDLRREYGRAEDLAGDKREARQHLDRAIEMDDRDWLACKYRGDVELVESPGDAIEWYRKAHQLVPEEPRVLVPFLECELRMYRDARVLQMMRGSLQAGIDECERRVDLQVHLPQAYLEHGRLALFLEPDKPYRALAAYARALMDWRYFMLFVEEHAAIERIVAALEHGPDAPGLVECEPLQGFIWVRDFLRVAIDAKARQILLDCKDGATLPAGLHAAATRWREADALDGIRTPDVAGHPGFTAPILIVAGGCAPESYQHVDSCKNMLKKAFKGFAGTVIGGGTGAGISGLVATLFGRRPDVRLLGYLPGAQHRPQEDRVHRAYTILETRGCGYTPLGPIQTWADLLHNNIAAKDVLVLGVNGGDLAGFEYRLALALGAVVGVIEGTGREAERLLPDPFWQKATNFAPLPRDWASIAAFVNLGRPTEVPLTGRLLDKLARRVHENYRKPALNTPGRVPDNLLPWRSLPDPLKDSNRHQVRYAVYILRAAGFDVVPRQSRKSSRPRIPDSFAGRRELMAEMEHGRYNAERLSTGWRLGEVNDVQRRTNPTLVPWANLPDHIKDYDRTAVDKWPQLLWDAGLRIIDP